MSKPFVLGFRVVLTLVFALLVPLLNGCSAVRTIGMTGVGLANSPVSSGGKRNSVKPFAWMLGNEPNVETTITVQKPKEDVETFYRNELAKRGWREKERIPEASSQMEFIRESKIGAWTYASETLSMSIYDPSTQEKPSLPVEVSITIYGKYAWDKPSDLVANGIGKIFGPYSEGVIYLFLPL